MKKIQVFVVLVAMTVASGPSLAGEKSWDDGWRDDREADYAFAVLNHLPNEACQAAGSVYRWAVEHRDQARFNLWKRRMTDACKDASKADGAPTGKGTSA